jgi:short-subunit dehydrogenase
MRDSHEKMVRAAAVAAGAYAAYRAVLMFSRRYDFHNRLVVITGASRGLGLVLARQLADEGAALVLCARDEVELAVAAAELRQRTSFVATYSADLSELDQITSLFTRIRREVGSVDVLINNAGVIQVGPVETMTLKDYERAMRLHFWAPLICTELVLPDMRRRAEGRIVNISSIGGEIGVPHLTPYCASKFALNGLSQALRSELVKDGVYITTVCPGLMRTGSPRNALFKGQHQAEYAWFSIAGSLPLVSMNADRAAGQIIRACRYGRAKITLSLPAKMAVITNTIAPELTADINGLVASLLPRRGGIGRAAAKGSESESSWSPPVLTTLNERAALKNNEVQSLNS